MLTSPGVQVTVVDESFYSPSRPGTVPAIFVVSAGNKMNAAGTGIARGTLRENSNRPFLVTSQRELADLFGDPTFQVGANNTPIHASELNEYGLQAAYSFLRSNNRAWVTRADIDLSELVPLTHAPVGEPTEGTYWLDVENSDWGIYVWDQVTQRFEKTPAIPVVNETDMEQGVQGANGTTGFIPKSSIGKVGSYAMVFGSVVVRLFYRNTSGTWVLVGSDKWKASLPTVQGSVSNPQFGAPSATLTINGHNITVSNTDTVRDVVDNINGDFILGITASVIHNRLALHSDGNTGVAGELEVGGDSTLLDELGIQVDDSGGTRTYYPPELHISRHTNVPEFKRRDSKPRPTGSMWLKTTVLGGGANWEMKTWNTSTLIWDHVPVPLFDSSQQAIYSLDPTGGGSNLRTNQIYGLYNVSGNEDQLGTFKLYRRNSSTETVAYGRVIGQSGIQPRTYTIKVMSTDIGSPSFSSEVSVQFTTVGSTIDAEIVAGAIAGAGVPNVVASVTSDNKVKLVHELGGEIRLIDDEINPVIVSIGFAAYINQNAGTRNVYYAPGTSGDTTPLTLQVSSWRPTVDVGTNAVTFYVPGTLAASSLPANGRLWFNSNVGDVDLMVHNGYTWVGYHNYSPEYERCDPNGPIVMPSMPLTQSNGNPLVDGDIWVDISNFDEYPVVYRFDEDLAGGDISTSINIANGWQLLDTTDQLTENGVLFADARYNTNGSNSAVAGTIPDLLKSDYLDPDAPDPSLYPRGMLLWNTRRSGFNVKRFVHNYIDMLSFNERFYAEPTNTYYPHRWVTESSNQQDGRGSFGRIAQRQVVVQALQRVITSNEEIRDIESRSFNLLATPGYPEVISEMITLNYDRRLSALVIGDSPSRLNPSATTINEWATNERGATRDGDVGLVNSDNNLAIYYPWGLTSDNFGRDVVVPPSHMMLATIAQSDRLSYPWFAPAGVRRGGIINATSVGFINSSNQFQPVALNEGQRDTLYDNSINPIAFMGGSGIIAHGQKTRARSLSALDRINVARLIVHIRRQLDVLTRPFIYQPNDAMTRDEVTNVLEGFFIHLTSQRALADYLIVCDESNNTPIRIDRNQLWVDIAIVPVKTVEFIYVPLRIRNTGGI